MRGRERGRALFGVLWIVVCGGMAVQAYRTGASFLFVLVPAAMGVFGAIKIFGGARGRGRRRDVPPPETRASVAPPRRRERPTDLRCPSCAAVARKTDITPQGEIECSYCGQWFDPYRTD